MKEFLNTRRISFEPEKVEGTPAKRQRDLARQAAVSREDYTPKLKLIVDPL